jgi:HK97 family phage major capsid protein
MEKSEISSKIIKLQDDFSEFSDVALKRMDFLEEKLSGFKPSLQIKSIDTGSDNEKTVFINFLRTGQYKSETGEREMKSHKEGSHGISISNSAYGLINSHLEKFSALRKVCNVQYISSDSFDVITEEQRGEATWGMETYDKKHTKKFIKLHELICQPKATLKLIEDVKVDVETYMAEKIAESFAMAEERAFLYGNGIDMPVGMLTYSAGEAAGFIEKIEGPMETESILNLMESLESFYSSEGVFLMNKSTESLIKPLKDKSGRYIWNSRLCEKEQNTILGVPVYTSQFMPLAEPGNAAIIFGNFRKGYQIIEKTGYNMIRDPYTEKPFVKFYTSKKVGGDVTDGRALKILQMI